ncbi:hypothetical protein ROHU_022641 [Labeo rohita]|uniref:Uncharacterized protein n=1 Tax=Labeo rohita TaxID=84645 RepID=A0A498MVJ5_LABRO|nr:hypothetical protein ROHU_022641 [Labeo rohita]
MFHCDLKYAMIRNNIRSRASVGTGSRRLHFTWLTAATPRSTFACFCEIRALLLQAALGGSRRPMTRSAPFASSPRVLPFCGQLNSNCYHLLPTRSPVRHIHVQIRPSNRYKIFCKRAGPAIAVERD